MEVLETMLFREQKQDYDLIVEEYFGIIKGKEKLVFIKTGKGGTYRGYEDKYSKIACDIYKMTGYSVAVSSNPVEYGCDLGLEIEYVSDFLDDYEEIIFIGISNGAQIGAEQGYKIRAIKKMLLINGPLMINFYKTKNGINEFKGIEVLFVYGKMDPSYKYVELLNTIDNDKCSYIVLDNVDHNFSKKIDTLIKLVVEFVIRKA